MPRSAPGSASRWPATSATPPTAPSSGCRSTSSACTPAWPGTWLLPNVVGPAHARDLLLTGRVVEADEALRLGLVSRVVDADGFLDEVLETAAGIAATAPIASRLTKIALADGGHADFEVGPAVGGARPADDPRDRRPAGGHRRGEGEAGAGVPRPLSRVPGRQKGPRSLRRLPSPADVEEPWGPSGEHARSRAATGQRVGVHACGQGCGGGVQRARWSVEDRLRGGESPVGDTPGASSYCAGDQRVRRERGCGGEKGERPVGVRRGPGTGRHPAPDRVPHGAPARGEPPDRGLPQRRAHDPAAARGRGTPPRRGRHAHRARRHRAEHGRGDHRRVQRRGPRAPGEAREDRGSARDRRRGAPGAAARRPPLPQRLVRRRVAARGDGHDRDGARPRLPRADRPQPAAPGGQRAQRRAAHPPARRRRRRQRAPRRVVHAPQGDRGRHPRRRLARPDRRDARPPRRPRGVGALQAPDGRRPR